MSQKMNKRKQQAAFDRKNADQGDFFFAKFKMSNNKIIPRPVLVIGKKLDSNDAEDVIVCSCTSQPKRTSYDKIIQLKQETVVRTNKIYTVSKEQLEFKIQHNVKKQR